MIIYKIYSKTHSFVFAGDDKLDSADKYDKCKNCSKKNTDYLGYCVTTFNAADLAVFNDGSIFFVNFAKVWIIFIKMCSWVRKQKVKKMVNVSSMFA